MIIAISPELVTHLLFMSRSPENFRLANDVSLWNEICNYNTSRYLKIMSEVTVMTRR